MALLPCDLTPPLEGDKVHLVIWYKDSIDLPIYSYDARGTAPEKGTHWAAESSLGERAYFRYKDVPSKLVLQNIREADGGMYRCRVDFRKSPTRNSKVNLTIILPPQKLSVLDEHGAHIQHYILGPYSEGASVEITCLATGGRPLPRVTWWQENALLDDSYETLSERRVRNVLHLERLERRHLHTVFTCQAANNNLVAPISSAVTLDLYLDPLWVRLLGQNRPMSADQTYEVSCEVVGARPAPIISWWKGTEPLRNARESVSSDGNCTVSVLKLSLSLEDAGETLSCRATTPPAERNVLQDTWTLNIYHVPLVYLELKGSLNGSIIKEGMNLVLECRIKSNPWVYRISWRHNGKTLFNNASSGTVIGNQTLALQNVSRARAGIYTCVGSNQEGDGESNPVVLDVKLPVSKYPIYEAVRVKRSANPDQKSKRRRKNRDAQEVKLDELTRKKEKFLSELSLTALKSRKDIAEITKGQTVSAIWRKERRKRLTASNFGMVCTRKDEASCKQAVFNILYGSVDNVYTRHGLTMEPQALKALREKFGVKGRRSGVFIDEELPYLAATPDIPVCRPGQQRTVGVARGEAARVTCEVEANPPAVHFSWKFNNSAETMDIPETHFTVDRSRSTAVYTPITDWDFGSLLCWSRNDLGIQPEPCVYSVVPAAGRPEPLGNCSIVNQTADSLHVECDPGHDGGLPQQFVMEVYDALDHTLVHNVTSLAPVFLGTGLPPDLELDVVFYSANAKGRSRSSTLHAYTLRSAARRSVISPVMMHMTPMLGVLVGAVVTFICVLVAILVALRLRKPSCQAKKGHKCVTTSAHTSSDSMDSLEKNPDIIPQKSDFLDSDDSAFQKSKLSFYFSPECDLKAAAKPVFADVQMPTAAYFQRSPTLNQPRRVTFQCQAATLPRRLGARPPDRRQAGPSDDSVLDLPGSLVRLRPETSSGPLLVREGARTPTEVQCLTTTHF